MSKVCVVCRLQLGEGKSNGTIGNEPTGTFCPKCLRITKQLNYYRAAYRRTKNPEYLRLAKRVKDVLKKRENIFKGRIVKHW